MTVPSAVSPSVLGPGLYMTVDLLASAASPGSQPLPPACILGPKSSAGSLVADTELRLIGSASDADAAWGIGVATALCAKRWLEKNPTGILYGIAPTASGGTAATGTITFAGGPVTAAYNVLVTYCGRQFNIPWNVGEVLADIQTRTVATVNQQSANLPLTLTAGGAGVVTGTFKVPGPWGNDVLFSAVLQNGAGATVAVSGSGAFTGGTTEPDFSTALATIANTEFSFLIPCVSNADAQSASATSNPGRVKSKINSMNTGLNPKLQQAVVGLTSTEALAKTGAIGRNEPVMEYVQCINGQSLPCEWAGAECGDRMAGISIDPAVNRIGSLLDNCFGSANIVADRPSPVVIEDALGNGVSIVSYTAQNVPIIVRPITTHSQDAVGAPDRRVLDTSGVDGMYAVGRDIRSALPAEFPKAKISKDLEPGDEPLPAGVVEERDILAFLIARLRFWQRRGVVRQDLLNAAIAAGNIIVLVDEIDGTQVNIVIPLGIFKPLAKFGVYMQKVA